MAIGYASARPPLHSRIVARIADRLDLEEPVEFALDIGCGAGLSTRPLSAVALRVLGLDPAHAMTVAARHVAPACDFVCAAGEHLPLADSSVDLAFAAGSLNYSNPFVVMTEVARVLRPGGALCVYDFSQGRKMVGDARLEAAFDRFRERYPLPAAHALPLDPKKLASLAQGYEIGPTERFEFGVEMTSEEYLAYLMTETNVAEAIARGTAAMEIREWLAGEFGPLFGSNARTVLYPGYLACFTASTPN